jgi:1-acyl-sn-glycerol-3-phosphate acyltransferase
MKYLLIPTRVLWKILFLLNFVLGLLLLYPFFYIALSRKKWFPMAFRLKKVWAYWILVIPGLFLKRSYRIPAKNLPQPCIYCGNHVSYLDIVTSYLLTPNYFVFMGKQELDKAPLFRIFFKEMNILVDRKSSMASHKAFLRAGQELENGHSIFLFPEGTISSAGQLRPFKSSAFKLAIEKQVPVVPVTFLNNWKMLQNGGFFKSYGKPGICRVVIGEPIPTAGLTENDLLSLRGKVHAVIEKELNNYNTKF